jgi:hypothetical protein
MTNSLREPPSYLIGQSATVLALLAVFHSDAAHRVSARGFTATCARRGKSAIAGVFRAVALSLCSLLLAAAPGQAQTPTADSLSTAPSAPLPGLVAPYEINKILRSNGFSPLTPPRREGTTYVLRAIDHRDILMRVVVDARSGEIRAVNRVVPTGPDGVGGMMKPPHGGPGLYGSLSGPPSRDPTPGLAPSEPLPGPSSAPPPPGVVPPDHAVSIDRPAMGLKGADLSMPPTTQSGVRPDPHPIQEAPPLPRPRPSELTIQQAKSHAKMPKAPAVKPDAAPAAASIPPAMPRPAPAPPKKPPQVVPPG